MKRAIITLCTVATLAIGAVVYCYKSNEAKIVEYQNELITAVTQTTGDEWDVIEVRGEKMTVAYAQKIIEYINANY